MPEIDARLAQLETKVEELSRLTQENQKILRSMQKWDRIGLWAKVGIWVLVLGLPLLFLGPLLHMLSTAASDAAPALLGIPSTDQLQDALRQYQEFQNSQ